MYKCVVFLQGDKVRKLKASTKDKAVWQPEVNRLLDLKKQLASAQTNANANTNANVQKTNVAELEKAIVEQV
jgi:methionyl-tRNA synthetase